MRAVRAYVTERATILPHPFRGAPTRLGRLASWRGMSEVVYRSIRSRKEAGASPNVIRLCWKRISSLRTIRRSCTEAYVLGKRAAFYVPDIDDYRRSPGLNADPGKLRPRLAFSTQGALSSLSRTLRRAGVRILREDLSASSDRPSTTVAAYGEQDRRFHRGTLCVLSE